MNYELSTILFFSITFFIATLIQITFQYRWQTQLSPIFKNSFFIIFLGIIIWEINSSWINLILILIWLICLTILLKLNFLWYRKDSREINLIFLISIIPTIFLIEANNLFLIFVLLETQSFGFYILTAIKINKIESTEAALKYLAFGALTTSFYILGLSLIYQNSGTINLPLTNLNSSGELGIIIITIVFFGKLGLIPLHHWVPDTYTESPNNITLLFITLPKIAYLIAIIKINTYIPNLEFLAIISIYFGSFGAINQISIKRFLSWSSISQIGLILAVFNSGNWNNLIQFTIIYLIVLLVIFTFLFSLTTKFNNKLWWNLNSFPLILTKNPSLILLGILGFISLAGLPPTGVFFAKFYIFTNIIDPTIIIIVVISTPITLAYSLLVLTKISTHNSSANEINSQIWINLEGENKLNKIIFIIIPLEITFILSWGLWIN